MIAAIVLFSIAAVLFFICGLIAVLFIGWLKS